MVTGNDAHHYLEDRIAQYAARDPELHRELREKVLAPPTPGAAASAAALELELPAAVGESPIDRARRVAETIVRPTARPVMVIRDNRATIEFLGPDSQVWASRITEAQSILDAVIPAVGRVEVNNHPVFTWVGTGWLVAEDLIVTNRHVAREFGRRGTAGFTFRVGVNGGPMTARLDFLEEDQRASSLEYGVSDIVWIAPPSEADVAFMRLTRTVRDRPLPAVVPLAESIDRDDFIAAIGYPARDPRVPDQDLVRQIFGDVYEKKRLAPGQIIEVSDDELEHDCSTLGGNSGSVLVNLRTGRAVGLHFSGVFLEANFAVPASRIADLLQQVRRGEAPGRVPAVVTTSPAGAAPVTPVTTSAAANSLTLRWQIPVEISVRIGAPDGSGTQSVVAPAGVATIPSGAPGDYDAALRSVEELARSVPGVISVRPGYRFKRGWITNERVIVVEVKEKLSLPELRASGVPALPPHVAGVGVDVRTAALPDQLEALGIDLETLEAPPHPGSYREPSHLRLTRVRERMKAVFHASPDSGFPNLRAFLGRVQHSLTATMFEWEPNHISDAIADVISGGGGSLKMVTQRAGTAAAVEDMKARLGGRFDHVFASVGAGRLFPHAYHIKVASRDGKEFWLSSGNWKDSNQADIDPAGENSTSIQPLRQHNREWHVIIENATLAKLFADYIEFDFSEAKRVPLEEALEVALPDVFVPEEVFAEALERRVTVRYFDPLPLDRELDVQPLLTPDRDSRGRRIFMVHALDMIAKATRRIYVENQSFNLLDENADEFEEFFTRLKGKQDSGLDVRIIFRDAREFGRDARTSQQRLLERIKDFGFDTDFIKLQRHCHTKGIIIDAQEVMLGSHNLTNEGSLFNRDASLRVRDAEVAKYFEQIFLFDWEVLATQEADELVGGMRLAPLTEATPPGFRRVSLSELLA